MRRVLRGRKRIETERFWSYVLTTCLRREFCQPGLQGAHEKDGVENGGGRFRRTHLVPVPQVTDFPALNTLLRQACLADDQRHPSGRTQTIAQAWQTDFKRFAYAAVTLAGIKLIHQIKKKQLDGLVLCPAHTRTPKVWEAVLAA